METVFGLNVGVSLAAACGFRVFVPMLVMGIAARAGQLELAKGFEWLASWPALVAFTVATVTEVCGYYIPFLGHLLDTMATPAAVVAGTIATAASVSHMSPMMQWSVAIIAGGGAAGVVQGTTVVARVASTATTGGLGNPIVATLELILSVVLSVLAIVVPILAAIVLCIVAFFVVRTILRRRAKRAIIVVMTTASPPSDAEA